MKNPTREQEFQLWWKRIAISYVLIAPKGGKPTIAVPLHLKSRWHPAGAKRQKGELRRQLARQEESGILLTLTTDPSKDGNNACATRKIWGKYRLFRDRLNRRLKRRSQAPFRAVTVLEFTGRGAPHLHAWLPGRGFLAPQAELQKLWGAIVDVRKARGAVAGYVVKYLGKLEKLPLEMKTVLWESRIKMYSVSPNLRAPCAAKYCAGGEIVGFGNCCAIEFLKKPIRMRELILLAWGNIRAPPA